MGRPRQERCKRGHQEWAYHPNGDRYCRPCRIESAREYRRLHPTPVPLPDAPDIIWDTDWTVPVDETPHGGRPYTNKVGAPPPRRLVHDPADHDIRVWLEFDCEGFCEIWCEACGLPAEHFDTPEEYREWRGA